MINDLLNSTAAAARLLVLTERVTVAMRAQKKLLHIVFILNMLLISCSMSLIFNASGTRQFPAVNTDLD